MPKRKGQKELSDFDSTIAEEIRKKPFLYNEKDISNPEGKTRDAIFEEVTSNINTKIQGKNCNYIKG